MRGLRGLAFLFLGLLLVGAGGCRRHDFPYFAGDYREFAYVTNSGSASVTVLDLVNMRQDRVIGVGQRPTGVTANPVRNEVYAGKPGTNCVSVIHTRQTSG